jgi:glycosyltransferase involved in cell wall biosynthesis
MRSKRKIIVVSGINITHGGPLSILEDCLTFLSDNLSTECDIYALVAYEGLLSIPNIHFKSFPTSKTSYFHKLYHEYVVFDRLSRELNPDLWISLSNINPNVESKIVASYFHNPALFYKPRLLDFVTEPRLLAFKMLYSFFSKINSDKVTYFVVQSDWMKTHYQAFLPKSKFVVSRPALPQSTLSYNHHDVSEKKKVLFFFPSFPRAFKNFEIIAKATSLLNKQGLEDRFSAMITLSGNENLYSKWLKWRYGKMANFVFAGLLTREKVFEYYGECDCLIFPSRLETWGLPISEFKEFKKPILAARMGYAVETVGNYEQVKFFNPDDEKELASYMEQIIKRTLVFDKNNVANDDSVKKNWGELFSLLLD